MLRNLVLVVVAFLSCSLSAAGQKVYDLDPNREAAILLPSTFLLLHSQAKSVELQPVFWKEVQTWSRDEVNGFDRSATFNYNETIASVSDVINNGLLLAPAILFSGERGRAHTKEIVVMYGEALLLSTALVRTAKVHAQRRRPFVFNEDAPFDRKPLANARTSFFSGHTTSSAMASFLTASIYVDLYPDRDHTLTWILAAGLPAVTGYLRYEAGEHYLTDVIVGYGVGSLIGWAIPRLHRTGVNIFSDGSAVGLTYQKRF